MNSENEARKHLNDERSWQWHLTFTGRKMQHNYYLYKIIDGIMCDNPNLAGIIEIGTGYGALTTYLALWGIKYDIPVLTVDHQEMHDTRLFKQLNINYIQMDEFSPKFEQIVRLFLCKAKGPILFICDGGNKIKEFNLFASILPTDSIIAVHDWTIEATLPDIEKAVNNYCIPYNKEMWNLMNVQFATFKIKRPFLSIVTRNHPARSEVINECKASLKDLNPGDYQHIIIPDEKGEGIPTANRMFFENRHLITGKYVFILDDDDVLISDDLISDLRILIRRHDTPGIVFIRMKLGEKIIPTEEVWRKDKLLPGSLGSSCFIMINSLWQECVDEFKTTETPGDFNFINSAFSKCPNIYWQDKIYSEASKLRRGGKGE